MCVVNEETAVLGAGGQSYGVGGRPITVRLILK